MWCSPSSAASQTLTAPEAGNTRDTKDLSNSEGECFPSSLQKLWRRGADAELLDWTAKTFMWQFNWGRLGQKNKK